MVGIRQLHDAGLDLHTPSRPLLRGNRRRPAVRTLKKPLTVNADRPHGPLAQAQSYPDTNDMTRSEDIGKAATSWHTKAREGLRRPHLRRADGRVGFSRWRDR